MPLPGKHSIGLHPGKWVSGIAGPGARPIPRIGGKHVTAEIRGEGAIYGYPDMKAVGRRDTDFLGSDGGVVRDLQGWSGSQPDHFDRRGIGPAADERTPGVQLMDEEHARERLSRDGIGAIGLPRDGVSQDLPL
jgi:hypothetical protein